tara:strand:+ start:5864 stop:6100 length:237 start_codon:yes stop_codon:yes gene_type:complete
MADIDITVDDFYNSLDESDIQDLLYVLTYEGRITKLDIIKDQNIMDDEWDKMCIKLSKLRLRLTNAEEYTIREISKKY